MKIAIHKAPGFAKEWISYCQQFGYNYKIVNCYDNDIIDQLQDCDALMWHYHHDSESDRLFAKELLYALEQSGKRVFPNFHTNWHFDDKLGQKYLFEALKAPIIPTYVFYDKYKAIEWLDKTRFPKVFKLRNGAGSWNVKLIESKKDAIQIVEKAFGKGFSHQINSWEYLRERWRKYKLGQANARNLRGAIKKLFYMPKEERKTKREVNYVYFQDFIPQNDSDTRIIVIADKAFAIKRKVRENDFRASGSGVIDYRKEVFDESTINLAFELADKLKSQCVAFDFIFSNGKPLIVEMSYGFTIEVYKKCEGYWDKDLNWYSGSFNPYGWMVELLS